jgi:hypothetical protein
MSIQLPTNVDVLIKWQTALGDKGKAPVIVDLSSADWTPPSGFEVGKLTCTSGATIKIDWYDGTYTVSGLILPAEAVISIVNVSKIYRTGTDAVNLVAWPIIY